MLLLIIKTGYKYSALNLILLCDAYITEINQLRSENRNWRHVLLVANITRVFANRNVSATNEE